jgi:RNA polymerase-binding transcription factor DksA
MSGYIGNPDAESEYALVLSENGIHASQLMLKGRILTHCNDCGDQIPALRIAYAMKANIKCEYCVRCQVHHDHQPRVRMLDRIL